MHIAKDKLQFREAKAEDIKQIQYVRNAVKENMLSHPSVVRDADCEEYITIRGKGWICEANEKIIGFAIADLKGNSIWALFILPEYEGKGIGKKLYAIMLDWYFTQTDIPLWLTTAPHTRAEQFYIRQGWKQAGIVNKEMKFEMEKDAWQKLKTSTLENI